MGGIIIQHGDYTYLSKFTMSLLFIIAITALTQIDFGKAKNTVPQYREQPREWWDIDPTKPISVDNGPSLIIPVLFNHGTTVDGFARNLCTMSSKTKTEFDGCVEPMKNAIRKYVRKHYRSHRDK